jgi:hypothetical protein
VSATRRTEVVAGAGVVEIIPAEAVPMEATRIAQAQAAGRVRRMWWISSYTRNGYIAAMDSRGRLTGSLRRGEELAMFAEPSRIRAAIDRWRNCS